LVAADWRSLGDHIIQFPFKLSVAMTNKL